MTRAFYGAVTQKPGGDESPALLSTTPNALVGVPNCGCLQRWWKEDQVESTTRSMIVLVVSII